MAVQPLAWDNADVLEQNRQRILKEMRTLLHLYEARYELSSERVEEELTGGRLRETAEVCDWLIAWRAYRALIDAR